MAFLWDAAIGADFGRGNLMQMRNIAIPASSAGSQVWIIDRNLLFLEGMRLLLADSSLSVALSATNLAEMQAKAQSLDAPDVILIGLNTPLVEYGEEIVSIAMVCECFSGVPVVVLSDLMSMDHLKQSMNAGASGYVLRSISPTALQHSLSLAISGEKVLPTELVALLVAERSFGAVQRTMETTRLSNRERAILRCLANGSSNKQIANDLKIAEGTVKVHVKAIFKKVGARNRTDAAVWALNNGSEVSG